MKKILKIAKGILLYVTLLYLGLFVASVDSMTDTVLFVSFFILVCLMFASYMALKDEDLEQYVPKWFR